MVCARVVSIDRGRFAHPDFIVLYMGHAAITGRLREMLYVQHVCLLRLRSDLYMSAPSSHCHGNQAEETPESEASAMQIPVSASEPKFCNGTVISTRSDQEEMSFQSALPSAAIPDLLSR